MQCFVNRHKETQSKRTGMVAKVLRISKFPDTVLLVILLHYSLVFDNFFSVSKLSTKTLLLSKKQTILSLKVVGPIRRLWVRVPLGNSDIFLSKNSSKNIIINNIYVRASIHLTLIIMNLYCAC